MLKTKRTVAYIPIETLGSPASTFVSVGRLIIALSDIVCVEILLRFRASAISEPIFFKARLTTKGNDDEDFERITLNTFYIIKLSVKSTLRYVND